MSNLNPGFILFAEDDPDDRLLFKDALQECGLDPAILEQVRFVGDGEELMDFLLRRGAHAGTAASTRPDLVMLDLNMPRKDGREALKEIRAHPELRRIPVVVFTTSRADTDIVLAYQLGANSFVTKPATFDSLVSTLNTVVRYWFGVVELPPAAGIRT